MTVNNIDLDARFYRNRGGTNEVAVVVEFPHPDSPHAESFEMGKERFHVWDADDFRKFTVEQLEEIDRRLMERVGDMFNPPAAYDRMLTLLYEVLEERKIIEELGEDLEHDDPDNYIG